MIALCRRLGANGRRDVAMRFRSQRLVDDIAGLYAELLNQRRSRGLEPVPWPSPHSEQNSLGDSADARRVLEERQRLRAVFRAPTPLRVRARGECARTPQSACCASGV